MRPLLLVAALACAVPARAEEPTEKTQLAAELAALQAQMAQMKERMAALEEKLANKQVDAAPTPPQTAARGASTFNPEISLILQGAYASRKRVDEPHISGFAGAGHHDADGRGFNLDDTELVLAASIDPYWRGQATLAVLDGEAEVEEAWFQTTTLGYGVGLKAGRFLSSIGYLNEQHAHQWDFYEQPLMYKALFGGHGYTQDGVQLKWVAPLETWVELGAELGRGQNFPGTDRNGNGANSWALFAHAGSDIGHSHSWRAGFSWLKTRAGGRESHFDSATFNEVSGLWDGRSRVWMVDLVYKWSPDGNTARRNFKLQAEYFRRLENGDLSVTYSGNNAESPWRTRQSGFYLAGVYQFTPNWRAGLRYDRLNSGRQFLGDNPADIETVSWIPRRITAMVDYNWSEFSRLRLQFARDRSMKGIVDHQLTLQYVVSLGSHGAHKF